MLKHGLPEKSRSATTVLAAQIHWAATSELPLWVEYSRPTLSARLSGSGGFGGKPASPAPAFIGSGVIGAAPTLLILPRFNDPTVSRARTSLTFAALLTPCHARYAPSSIASCSPRRRAAPFIILSRPARVFAPASRATARCRASPARRPSRCGRLRSAAR